MPLLIDMYLPPEVKCQVHTCYTYVDRSLNSTFELLYYIHVVFNVGFR